MFVHMSVRAHAIIKHAINHAHPVGCGLVVGYPCSRAIDRVAFADQVDCRTAYNDVSLSAAKLRGPPGSLQAANAKETPDHQRLHDPDEEPGRWRERQGTPVHSQGYWCNQGAQG